MEENTDMTRVQAIRFGEWIAENYEPCKENSWKKRFPKTSEEKKQVLRNIAAQIQQSKGTSDSQQ